MAQLGAQGQVPLVEEIEMAVCSQVVVVHMLVPLVEEIEMVASLQVEVVHKLGP